MTCLFAPSPRVCERWRERGSTNRRLSGLHNGNSPLIRFIGVLLTEASRCQLEIKEEPSSGRLNPSDSSI